MIPVDQTKFGKPHGNCFMACVASLLEISIKETPPLGEAMEACAETKDWAPWYRAVGDFLAARGWAISEPHLPIGWAPNGWAIANGPAARGLRHSVVVFDGAEMHDPHPDRSGLEETEDYVVLVEITKEPARAPTTT